MVECTKYGNFENIIKMLKENWDHLFLFGLSVFFFQLNYKALYLLDNLYLARNSDAWFNFGFMLYPKELFTKAPLVYHWDRLPWELSGNLLFQLFPPVQAHYLLHFTFFIVTIFSFFLICKFFFNYKTALISTILLLSFTPFMIYMGTNYIDSPVFTFFLLSFLMLVTISNKNKMYLKIGLSGVFFACMIISHPKSFFIYTIPLIGLYYILTPMLNKKQHLYSIISLVIGIISTTLFFSVVFYLMTGSFSFMRGTINFLLKYNIGPNPWYYPWYVWVEPFHYIIFISFILAILWLFIMWYKKQNSLKRMLLPLSFIVACLFYIFMSIKPNPTSMLKNLSACLLFPLMFFALGTLLDKPIRMIRRELFPIVIAFGLGLIILPYILISADAHFSQLIIQTVSKNFGLLLVITFVIFLCLIAKPYLKRSKKNAKSDWPLLLCTILIFISFSAFNIVTEPGLFSGNSKYQIDSFENGFISVTETMQIIHEGAEITDRKVVWYNETEKDNHGAFYGGLFETIGYTLVSYNYNFPEYSLTNITKICSDKPEKNCEKTKLFVLSTDPSIFQKIQNAFREEKQTVILLKTNHIDNGNIRFNISIIKFI